MNKYNLTPLLILFLVSIIFSANAQEQLLKKTFDKISACKSISYEAKTTSSGFFSDDIFTIDAKASYTRSNNSVLLYNVYSQTKSDKGFNNINHDIYNGTDLLLLVYTDTTYRIKKNYTEPYFADYSVINLADQLSKDLKTGNYAVSQLKDSTVNNTICYHILIKTIDSIAKKTNSYNNTDLLISKADYLPAYWRVNQQGVAEKGRMKIGTIKMFSSTYASNYRLNNIAADAFALKIPAGFKEEKPKLPPLSKGIAAPTWQLTATNGKTLSLADLKGKVTLLDITSTSCPACMLSIPPLNRLDEKYKGTDVAIVSINLDETKEAVSKFITRNKVTYPVYLNGNSIKAAYHVSFIPTFYIVDKQGVISEAYEGFSEDFEQDVTKKIDALR